MASVARVPSVHPLVVLQVRGLRSPED